MKITDSHLNYKKNLFHPPGHSEIFTRVIFRLYNKVLNKIIGGEEIYSFQRSFATLLIVVCLTGLFFAGNIGDVYRIYNGDGYDRASTIFARDKDNNPVAISEFYRQGRKIIHLNSNKERGLGSKVAKCFIAAEDNHFKTHFGLDLKGILRASIVNTMAGGIKEGASTISQQVARLRFLSKEKNFLRKIREAFYAIFLELRFEKYEILELYLNEVHLGHGSNGVESASQFYFSKHFQELSWGEAALLSSLTTRPHDFSPLRNIDTSRKKVQVTFSKLIENGEMDVATAQREYKLLENNYYKTLNRSPWDSARNQRRNDFPYVTEYIRSKVLKYFTKNSLYVGGLKIYTTIVAEHQSAAQKEFISYLKEQSKKRHKKPFEHYEYFEDAMGHMKQMIGLMFPVKDTRMNVTRSERVFLRHFASEHMNDIGMLSYLVGSSDGNRVFEHYMNYGEKFVEQNQNVEGGLVSIRPHSGEITAMIGGSGFATRNQMMRFATARRQPGSSFKPLVYSACIEHSKIHKDAKYKLTASSMIEDAPIHFINHDLSEYSPENYSHSYDGWMRLREALVKSKNTVAVQVYKNCGPGNVNPIVSRLLDLKTRKRGQKIIPREATVALGSFVVTPLEMAKAYAVFASNGMRVNPHLLTHITNYNGQKLLKDFRPQIKNSKKEQIISSGTAKIMVSMLKDVVGRGTGRGAFLSGRQTAGKTGTTNRNTNAWFVGFTPKLVTALYIGFDKPVSLGGGATGGGLAAPVWRRYMQKALKNEKTSSFSFANAKTLSVEICKETGSLPTANCIEKMVELYLHGTQPTDSRSPYDELPDDENENLDKGPNKSSRQDVFTDDGL